MNEQEHKDIIEHTFTKINAALMALDGIASNLEAADYEGSEYAAIAYKSLKALQTQMKAEKFRASIRGAI